MALFQTGMNTSTGVSSVSVFVRVLTPILQMIILMVSIISFESRTDYIEAFFERCLYACVSVCEKRTEREARCLVHAVILFDVICL